MQITDPGELRHSLVEQLRGIPELVTLLRNDAANIVEYVDKDNGDLASTIKNLQKPKLLVYLNSVAGSPYPSKIIVTFGIALRVNEPTMVYATLLSGMSDTSGTDGQPLLNSVVHPSYDPMYPVPSLDRRVIGVDSNSFFDYWEVVMSFRDRTS